MRILAQRVRSAWVEWPGGATARCGPGLLCLAGFHRDDRESVLEPMTDKLLHLRIFGDETARLNRSLLDAGGALVLVPQFTLYADCRKGRRPSFTDALGPEAARGLFERWVELCRSRVARVECGPFGAHMQVHLVNDGPVTLLLDSQALGLRPA